MNATLQETPHDESLNNRVSIDQLRAIWNDDQEQYTDDQLMQIRDWLYSMAAIIIEVMHEEKHKAESSNTQYHETKTCTIVHEGIQRAA